MENMKVYMKGFEINYSNMKFLIDNKFNIQQIIRKILLHFKLNILWYIKFKFFLKLGTSYYKSFLNPSTILSNFILNIYYVINFSKTFKLWETILYFL